MNIDVTHRKVVLESGKVAYRVLLAGHQIGLVWRNVDVPRNAPDSWGGRLETAAHGPEDDLVGVSAVRTDTRQAAILALIACFFEET